MAIVGGGIAGTSLAYNLHQKDPRISTCIVEEDRIGSKPVSAQTFMDNLEPYGLRDSVTSRYDSMEFITTDNFSLPYYFDNDVFGLVDYPQMCSKLFKRSHADLIYGTALGISDNNLTLENGEKIRAKVFVDCSGTKAVLRKSLDLRRLKRGNHLYVCKLKNCDLDEPKKFSYFVGTLGSNGGWVYPMGKTECEVGVANRVNLCGSPINHELLIKNMKRFVSQRPELQDSEVCYSYFAEHPYEPLKKVVEGNTIFLGDCAGFMDSFIGTGLHVILDASMVCSNTITEHINNSNSLHTFQKYWEGEISSKYKWRWARAEVCFSLSTEEWKTLLMKKQKMHTNPEHILKHLKCIENFHIRDSLNYIPLSVILKMFLKVVEFDLRNM